MKTTPDEESVLAVLKMLTEAVTPERTLDQMYWNGKNMGQMTASELTEIAKELEAKDETN